MHDLPVIPLCGPGGVRQDHCDWKTPGGTCHWDEYSSTCTDSSIRFLTKNGACNIELTAAGSRHTGVWRCKSAVSGTYSDYVNITVSADCGSAGAGAHGGKLAGQLLFSGHLWWAGSFSSSSLLFFCSSSVAPDFVCAFLVLQKEMKDWKTKRAEMEGKKRSKEHEVTREDPVTVQWSLLITVRYMNR